MASIASLIFGYSLPDLRIRVVAEAEFQKISKSKQTFKQPKTGRERRIEQRYAVYKRKGRITIPVE